MRAAAHVVVTLCLLTFGGAATPSRAEPVLITKGHKGARTGSRLIVSGAGRFVVTAPDGSTQVAHRRLVVAAPEPGWWCAADQVEDPIDHCVEIGGAGPHALDLHQPRAAPHTAVRESGSASDMPHDDVVIDGRHHHLGTPATCIARQQAFALPLLREPVPPAMCKALKREPTCTSPGSTAFYALKSDCKALSPRSPEPTLDGPAPFCVASSVARMLIEPRVTDDPERMVRYAIVDTLLGVGPEFRVTGARSDPERGHGSDARRRRAAEEFSFPHFIVLADGRIEQLMHTGHRSQSLTFSGLGAYLGVQVIAPAGGLADPAPQYRALAKLVAALLDVHPGIARRLHPRTPLAEAERVVPGMAYTEGGPVVPEAELWRGVLGVSQVRAELRALHDAVHWRRLCEALLEEGHALETCGAFLNPAGPTFTFCGRTWSDADTTVACHDPGVSDLRPLLDRVHVTELDLAGSGVHDVTVLSTLTALARVNLSHTAVHDLRPLEQLALESVDLAATPVVGLTPLSGMASLRRLLVDATAIPAARIDRFAAANPHVTLARL